jgi:hypothetical protein
MHGAEHIGFTGQMVLSVVDRNGAEVDRREVNNLVCTVGYTQIAQALTWSGAQDQASTIGLTTPTYLTPLWGAVGNGSGTPAKSDTALFAELGRTTVGAAGSTPASSVVAAAATWLFYYGAPATTWTVTEAGLFAQGGSTAGSGFLMDHLLVTPNLTVLTSNYLILQMSFLFGP